MFPLLTYYAVRPHTIGGKVRQPGELIPEASEWSSANRASLIERGVIATVLIETLSEETQNELMEFFALREDAKAAADAKKENRP